MGISSSYGTVASLSVLTRKMPPARRQASVGDAAASASRDETRRTRSKRRSCTRPPPPITCLSLYSRSSCFPLMLYAALAGIIIFISTNNPIIPTVSASVAALDMTRGFSDHPLRGVDSSRPRRRRPYSSNKSALPAPFLSSWRMLHRPAEFVWRQESQWRRVSPAHAAASSPLSSLDALLSSHRRGGGRRRTIHTSRTTQLASSSQKKQAKKNQSAQSQAPTPEQGVPNYSYDDLTLLGRTIAGTVEIGFTVLIEYVTGFVGGYALGGITDLPRFLTQSAGQQAANNAVWWRELAARTSRMHVKSARWGRSWAGISAAFGGFRVTVRVLRNGKEDEWNTVLSSMAAGAFFARNGG